MLKVYVKAPQRTKRISLRKDLMPIRRSALEEGVERVILSSRVALLNIDLDTMSTCRTVF